MDTSRYTTARRAALLLLTGAGLGAAFVWGPARVGLAQSPARRPAARLAAPQPLDPADIPARAAAPNPPANASTIPDSWATPPPPASPPRPQPQPAAAPGGTLPASWLTGSQPGPVTQSPPAGSAWDSVKGAMVSSTQAVKSALGVKPGEPPPQPRVGQPRPPMSRPPTKPEETSTRPADWDGPPPRPANQPFQGTSPNGAPVYAGNPAYRWYGWGTTTPGLNPFAPGGEYPRGSANWFAQTGATPGAFPVPVANPFRPSPGGGPPVYLASSAPPPVAHVVYPRAVPAPRPIAETPPYTHVPTMATPWRVPTGVPVMPPGPVPPVNMPEPVWQPVARGQER